MSERILRSLDAQLSKLLNDITLEYEDLMKQRKNPQGLLYWLGLGIWGRFWILWAEKQHKIPSPLLLLMAWSLSALIDHIGMILEKQLPWSDRPREGARWLAASLGGFLLN